MEGEKGASMQCVGSALRGHHRLCAGEASVLRVIVVRHDANIVNRLFRRCDHGSAAPHRAHSADAVDRYSVRFILSAVRVHLRTVLGWGVPAIAGASGTLSPREAVDPAACLLRSIADCTWRELAQREYVAVERGHVLYVVRRHR